MRSAADGELRGTAEWILNQHPEWGEKAIDLVRTLIEQPELAEADEGPAELHIRLSDQYRHHGPGGRGARLAP